MAREATLGLIQMGLLIALIGIGVLLFHIGAFFLLPWRMETKAVLSMMLGLSYVVIGGLTLRSVMSEKKWIKKSGLAEMLEEASGQSNKE